MTKKLTDVELEVLQNIVLGVPITQSQRREALTSLVAQELVVGVVVPLPPSAQLGFFARSTTTTQLLTEKGLGVYVIRRTADCKSRISAAERERDSDLARARKSTYRVVGGA